MISRLRRRYADEFRPQLAHELGIANVMEVPQLVKVVVNSGVGEAISDQNAPENAARDLGIIAGQKPVITRATRSGGITPSSLISTSRKRPLPLRPAA